MVRLPIRTARSKRRVSCAFALGRVRLQLAIGTHPRRWPIGSVAVRACSNHQATGWVQHDSAQASAIEQPELAKRRAPRSTCSCGSAPRTPHRQPPCRPPRPRPQPSATPSRRGRRDNSSPSRSSYKHPGVNDPHVTADKSACPKLTGAMGFAGVVAQGLRSDMVGTHAFDPDPVHSRHAAGRSRRHRPTEPSNSCRTPQPRRQPNRE